MLLMCQSVNLRSMMIHVSFALARLSADSERRQLSGRSEGHIQDVVLESTF